MAIRPTDFTLPLTNLAGVADSSRSMDRDARERHARTGRGHVEGEDTGADQNQPAGTGEAHIIDESA